VADRRHFSVARGAQFYVGAPLARLISQLALGVLLDRFPRLRLVGGGVTRRADFRLRWLGELRVVAE